MKRCVMLLLLFLALWPASAMAVELDLEAPSALLMEKTTGQILYAKNEHQKLVFHTMMPILFFTESGV